MARPAATKAWWLRLGRTADSAEQEYVNAEEDVVAAAMMMVVTDKMP